MTKGLYRDLAGERFGRLIVVTRVARKTTRPRWLCRCDCGKEIETYSSSLVGGESMSCGCLARELVGLRSTTHGQHKSLAYRSWSAMKQRCYNSKNIKFSEYGRKGVIVCERWRSSFENFLADMGERPSVRHTLDRYPLGNGNYEPGNCRWATYSEQNANRRTYKRRKKIIPATGATL